MKNNQISLSLSLTLKMIENNQFYFLKVVNKFNNQMPNRFAFTTLDFHCTLNRRAHVNYNKKRTNNKEIKANNYYHPSITWAIVIIIMTINSSYFFLLRIHHNRFCFVFFYSIFFRFVPNKQFTEHLIAYTTSNYVWWRTIPA